MYASMSEAAEIGQSDPAESDGGSQEPPTKRRSGLPGLLDKGENDDADADEFRPDDDEFAIDDETTMEVEEKMGRDMSYEEEIKLLKRESEMSVEELRQMYAPMDKRSDDDDDDDQESSLNTSMHENDEVGEDGSREPGSEDTPAQSTAKRRKTEKPGDSGEQDEGLAALQVLHASEERARSTVASRPFLISKWVKLREYQQIGLNWLVSIQGRRLNGILADEMVSAAFTRSMRFAYFS